jgi:cell division protein ZapA
LNVKEVFIFGDKYRLKTDEDEVIVNEIADYLNNKMREIEKHSNVLTTSKIAVLAAFNIAAECVKLRNELDISNKIVTDLNKKIEEAIQG